MLDRCLLFVQCQCWTQGKYWTGDGGLYDANIEQVAAVCTKRMLNRCRMFVQWECWVQGKCSTGNGRLYNASISTVTRLQPAMCICKYECRVRFFTSFLIFIARLPVTRCLTTTKLSHCSRTGLFWNRNTCCSKSADSDVCRGRVLPSDMTLTRSSSAFIIKMIVTHFSKKITALRESFDKWIKSTKTVKQTWLKLVAARTFVLPSRATVPPARCMPANRISTLGVLQFSPEHALVITCLVTQSNKP